MQLIAYQEQQTALHISSRLGNVDNVVLLLQHGASPDATTKDLYTPLHIAAKEGHEEVAQVLLEQGASQTLMTKVGINLQCASFECFCGVFSYCPSLSLCVCMRVCMRAFLCVSVTFLSILILLGSENFAKSNQCNYIKKLDGTNPVFNLTIIFKVKLL